MASTYGIVEKIQNYETYKMYDGLLLGDNWIYDEWKRKTHIDLKSFVRIDKLFNYRSSDFQEYFYYEDEAYFYQKQYGRAIKKIWLKTKKLEILSGEVYVYDNSHYFMDTLLWNNMINFEIVDYQLLFWKKNAMSTIQIVWRDKKNVYLVGNWFWTYFFWKLELDYDSLEIIDEFTIKDDSNMWKYDRDSWEINIIE